MIKNYINSLLVFLFAFLYLANIAFVFFPGKLKTSLVISVIGLFFYLFKYNGRDPYKIGVMAKGILPLAIWMGFSILINTPSQIWFLQFAVLQIIYAIGAAFIVDISNSKTVLAFLWIIFLYVIIQNLTAFLGLQLPAISNFIHLIEKDTFFENREYALGYRALGFGEHVFFTGGVWSALGMLVVTCLYKIKSINIWEYVLSFSVIFITGLFVARTSMTGVISILLLFFPLKKRIRKLLQYSFFAILTLVIIFQLQKQLSNSNYNTEYAFEIIDNFTKSGELGTQSSDKTIAMWNTLPNNLSTWIAGDAMYTEEISGGYYKHVDVGYLRIIFYGGLIGLLLYIGYTIKLLHMFYVENNKNREILYFSYIYLALVLIWMWKGHIDTNPFLYLLIAASIKNKRKNIMGRSNIISRLQIRQDKSSHIRHLISQLR